MVGMMVGMLLAHVTMGNPFTIWLCFLSLTVFHMYGELNIFLLHLNIFDYQVLGLSLLICSYSFIMLDVNLAILVVYVIIYVIVKMN